MVLLVLCVGCAADAESSKQHADAAGASGAGASESGAGGSDAGGSGAGGTSSGGEGGWNGGGGSDCDCAGVAQCVGNTVQTPAQNPICGCDFTSIECEQECLDNGRNVLCGLTCNGKVCAAPAPSFQTPKLCCTTSGECGVAERVGEPDCVRMHPDAPPNSNCPKWNANWGCCVAGVCGVFHPAPGAGCVPPEELGIVDLVPCTTVDAG